MKYNGVDITAAYHNGEEITAIMLNGVDVGAFTPPTPPTPDYQPWENYPDSPVLTEDYPYQCITNGVYGLILVTSTLPLHYRATDAIRALTGALVNVYFLVSGEWSFSHSTTGGVTLVNGIDYRSYIEANNDIYTDNTLTSVFFAKTTA